MTKGLHKDSLQKVDNPHQWMIDDARMGLIQQIKAEVERRKKKAEHYIEACKVSERPFEYWSGQKDVLELFEKEFLSTLQEQPACEELEEEIKSWHKRHFKSRNSWEDYSGHYLDKNSQLDLARHFAQWGAEHATHAETPADLEEAANNYLDGVYGKIPHSDFHIAIFIAGAKWQAEQDTRDMYMSDNRHFNKVYELGKKDMREQMMKNAVEAEVFEYQSPLLYPEYYDDNPGPPAITLERDSVKPGDKVRIIILPPED